jgi:H+/Cl- antiporter ClcA
MSHEAPATPEPGASPPGPAGAPADTGPVQQSRQVAILSLIAVAVGLLAGAGASLFVAVEHHVQVWLWEDLPEALGQEQAPAWLAISLLVTGGVITYGATRLPGKAGHAPLDGLVLDIGPREVGSVVLASLASLSFGAVLGPEAPLLAIGTAAGALAFRDTGAPVRRVMMLVGAMAGMGAVFGNPLITCVLMLELAIMAGAAMATPVVLMPALAGLASSYVLQVGLADWSGLGETRLGLPGLAPYDSLQFIDLWVAVPLAILVAIISMAARLGGLRVRELAHRAPLTTLVGTGALVAICAITVDALTDGGLDLVLFSGQQAMTDYLALTSLGTAAVVLVGKFVAYAASLGSGFRGGPIFPAVALGVILSTAATLMVDGTSTSALAATGIAAATAAALRMPFTALLLGVVLTYPAGGATTILAIVGTIVGLVTRMAGEKYAPGLEAPVHR